MNFPGIPYALLVFLDEAIPERCPAPSDSSTEVMFYAGQRQTVRMLIERFKDENNIDPQDDWKQR